MPKYPIQITSPALPDGALIMYVEAATAADALALVTAQFGTHIGDTTLAIASGGSPLPTTQSAQQAGTIPGLTTGSIVITWPVAWSDAVYQATGTLDASASILGDVTVIGITAQTASTTTFAVQNAAITSKSVTLHAVGVKS